MGKTLVENGQNVVVRERVADAAAVSAEFHEVRLLEDTQLVRDGRLGCAYGLGDFVHAELIGHERIQNLDAGGVAEYLE